MTLSVAKRIHGLLDRYKDRYLHVSDIKRELPDITPGNISRHLSMLYHLGYLYRRGTGMNIQYRIAQRDKEQWVNIQRRLERKRRNMK